MRALVLLFLSISVHAAEVRFFTEHAKLFPGNTGGVFLENLGDDTIDDVRIEITIAETLDFATPVFGGVTRLRGYEVAQACELRRYVATP